MPLIQWTDDFLIGHTAIDYDHQMLVNITNQVYDMKNAPKVSNAQIGQCMKQLVDYVERHFRREEEIFGATDYPLTDSHKKMHRDLEKVAREIYDLYRREPDLLNFGEVTEFLKRWLLDHILKHDMGYKPYLKG
ncbi:Hemerythrin [Caenispirillum salinarum AK4]|uniref:Hemerythrin n=1 Tax=Caenispirillum salinarum AK4 TaxID=1238182 RepID=K9HUZ5_9PROT|nr:bacteriohemerythrin [Caenispirillum salinarum]EKV32081.1 Hemerythrin [Caenispirillum salinarum AK4]